MSNLQTLCSDCHDAIHTDVDAPTAKKRKSRRRKRRKRKPSPKTIRQYREIATGLAQKKYNLSEDEARAVAAADTTEAQVRKKFGLEEKHDNPKGHLYVLGMASAVALFYVGILNILGRGTIGAVFSWLALGFFIGFILKASELIGPEWGKEEEDDSG